MKEREGERQEEREVDGERWGGGERGRRESERERNVRGEG